MKKITAFLFCSLSLLAFAGAGCDTSALGSLAGAPSKTPSGPVPASFEGLLPKQAAEKIVFVGGNVVVMKQGFGGIGGAIAQKLGFGGFEGTRDVVIRSFAPAHRADIEWKLTTTVAPDPKNPKDIGTRQYTGTIVGADLLNSHTLYLPGYWVEGDQNAFGSSAIWLSQDVYEDLAKSHTATLDFGLLDPTLTSTLTIADDMKATLQKLKVNLDAVGLKKDVRLVEADKDPVNVTLKVNGKDVTVQAIKARNWFGEITVLDNKQNPLVLNVTLNPLLFGAMPSGSGTNFLKSVGYEVTEIKDVQQ